MAQLPMFFSAVSTPASRSKNRPTGSSVTLDLITEAASMAEGLDPAGNAPAPNTDSTPAIFFSKNAKDVRLSEFQRGA